MDTSSSQPFNITLSEHFAEFVQQQVASGAYRTPSDYVETLLRNAQRKKAQERIDELLLEGINSGPATPMTQDDWEDIRREVRDRLAAQRRP